MFCLNLSLNKNLALVLYTHIVVNESADRTIEDVSCIGSNPEHSARITDWSRTVEVLEVLSASMTIVLVGIMQP